MACLFGIGKTVTDKLSQALTIQVLFLWGKPALTPAAIADILTVVAKRSSLQQHMRAVVSTCAEKKGPAVRMLSLQKLVKIEW